MPELQLTDQTSDAPDPDFQNKGKDGYNTKAIQCFVAFVGLTLFFIPIIAASADYYTDITMFGFMEDIRSNYVSDYESISSSKSAANLNDLLICYPTNDNNYARNTADLYNYLTYVMYIYPNDTNNYNTNGRTCNCDIPSNYTLTDYSSNYCNGNEGINNDITTTNIDSQCNNINNNNIYNSNTNIECIYCNCGNISTYTSSSPQFGFSNYIYNNDTTTTKYKNTHCQPSKLNNRVKSSNNRKELETNLTDVRNANAAFLFLAGIWLVFYIMLAAIILFREFCRFMCHFCYERQRPPINYDEITWLVFILVMLHIFEDLPQLIISSCFSMYYLEDGGAECIANWADQDFKTDVEPPSRTEVSSLFDSFFWDPTVQLFFITSFAHVFVHGVYGISLVEFKFTKIFENKWQKNVIYFFISIILGFITLWLLLVPYWYVIWANASFFGFTGTLDFVLLLFVLGGGVAWIGVCIMWCIACFCCADGGDAECDCC